MKDQKGFVLISVVLITTISSLFALNAIQEGRLQERIGGNQQKEMNARLLAEKGLFDAFGYIEAQNKAKLDHADIKANLLTTYAAIDEIDLDILLDPDNNLFILKSTGSINGATAHLKAKIKVIPNAPRSITTDVVVACDGITITGSGKVDSYRSSEGAYDPNNPGRNGDIRTISDNANITMSGGEKVFGDISATGAIDINSGYVTGDVKANHDVTLNQVGSEEHGFIQNISTGGNLSFNAGVKVDHNINVSQNVTFSGDESAQVVGGELNYAGTSNIDALISASVNGRAPEVSTVESEDCDPFAIATNMGAISQDMVTRGITQSDGSITDPADTNIITTMTKQHAGEQDAPLRLSIVEGEVGSATVFADANNTSAVTTVATETLNTFMKNDAINSVDLENKHPREVFIFDDLHLVNRNIEIEGHVTILVRGDLSVGGGGAGFVFASGAAATSSLTILSEGSVDIGSDAQVFPGASFNKADDGKVPLTVYSSYEKEEVSSERQAILTDAQADFDVALEDKNNDPTAENISALVDAREARDAAQLDFDRVADNAFTFDGNTEMYASVYAPLGDINVGASGDLMGAIRGKNISITGDAGIHYDEALEDNSLIFDGDAGTSQYLMVNYYYPNH